MDIVEVGGQKRRVGVGKRRGLILLDGRGQPTTTYVSSLRVADRMRNPHVFHATSGRIKPEWQQHMHRMNLSPSKRSGRGKHRDYRDGYEGKEEEKGEEKLPEAPGGPTSSGPSTTAEETRELMDRLRVAMEARRKRLEESSEESKKLEEEVNKRLAAQETRRKERKATLEELEKCRMDKKSCEEYVAEATAITIKAAESTRQEEMRLKRQLDQLAGAVTTLATNLERVQGLYRFARQQLMEHGGPELPDLEQEEEE